MQSTHFPAVLHLCLVSHETHAIRHSSRAWLIAPFTAMQAVPHQARGLVNGELVPALPCQCLRRCCTAVWAWPGQCLVHALPVPAAEPAGQACLADRSPSQDAHCPAGLTPQMQMGLAGQMHASAAQAGVMPKAMQLQMQQRLRVSAGRSTSLPLQPVRHSGPGQHMLGLCRRPHAPWWRPCAANAPWAACWGIFGGASRPCCNACSCICLSWRQAAHTLQCLLPACPQPEGDRLLHATMPVGLMQPPKVPVLPEGTPLLQQADPICCRR